MYEFCMYMHAGMHTCIMPVAALGSRDHIIGFIIAPMASLRGPARKQWTAEKRSKEHYERMGNLFSRCSIRCGRRCVG